jgi:AAA family ATP:ADP antiporter
MTADGLKLSRELIEHSDSRVVEAALEGLAARPEQVADLAASGWIAQSAASPDPVRRRLAALAVGFGGDQGTGILHDLLADSDPVVVAAALRAAGMTGNRVYLQAILPRLADARLRGAAIESLAAYGTRIAGTIGDILEDEGSPIEIRRQLPRVLKAVPEQRSVETLIRHISHPHLTLRSAVLKALNSLRETKPGLDYGSAFVTRQILNEARYYFELSAILAPFRDRKDSHSAAGLLAASIEERLKETLERLFRLLGLRYPPKEIYAAYLAVHHGRRDQYATALEFLDNVLDRELKRFLLPLLDDSAHMMERGRGLFGVEAKTAEQAVRELIRSGDSWLAACAMAAAAELKFRELAPDIVEAARGAGAEVNEVALSARAALA